MARRAGGGAVKAGCFYGVNMKKLQPGQGRRGVVIKLPRAAGLLVLALIIVGSLWLGSWLESGFEGLSPYYFFSALLAFFAVVLAIFSVVVLRKAKAVRRWAAAAATIIESQVVWGSGQKGGRTLVARITYEYAAGGRVYQSKRIAFYRRGTGHWAQELVARHPTGSRVQIYYDPAQPAEAVLDPTFPARWLLPVFAVVLAALSVVFFKLGQRIL